MWPLLYQLQLIGLLVILSSEFTPANVNSTNTAFNDIIYLSIIPAEYVEKVTDKLKNGVLGFLSIDQSSE